MKMFINSYVLCLLLSFGTIIAAENNDTKHVACHLSKLEACFASLIKLGSEDEPVPNVVKSQELNKICNIIKNDVVDCIKNYISACGTPLYKELVGLGLDQALHGLNQYCKEGPLRTGKIKINDYMPFTIIIELIPLIELLANSQCLHEKLFTQDEFKQKCKNPYRILWNAFISNDTSFTIEESVDMICCGLQEWEQCLFSTVDTKCGQKALKAVHNLIAKGFFDVPNLFCPKDVFVATSDACKQWISVKNMLLQ